MLLCIYDRKWRRSFLCKGKQVSWRMKIIPSAWNNGVTVVNRVPMELYLKGVVPSEIVPSWKPDAIKAQAVAARTYAVYHKNGYRSAGYDMTDDTRSQVYRGCSVETSATNKAVEETAGEIITYNGKAIDALFMRMAADIQKTVKCMGIICPLSAGSKEENSSTVNRPWRKLFRLIHFPMQFHEQGILWGR